MHRIRFLFCLQRSPGLVAGFKRHTSTGKGRAGKRKRRKRGREEREKRGNGKREEGKRPYRLGTQPV